ncbi:MAG: ABC transporter permease, partial [Bacteroidetes bacterium]|nr:ABC transporter permease [Bacteroidota bacterium]
IKIFLRIAARQLYKRKGYSILNILGLTAGIVCCLLIFEYVAYERSFDDFHQKADRVFRVQDEEYQDGKLVVPCAAAMPGVAPNMRRDLPEIEAAFRLYKIDFLLANEARNIKFMEPTVYYADNSIFDVLDLPLVAGDPKTALAAPGKVILSETAARKYFGQEPALGKVLTIHASGKTRPLQVSGVFRDYPDNSHLKLSILVSYPTFAQVIGSAGKTDDVLETSFGWTDFYTYILLKKGVDHRQVAAKLPAFIDKYYNNIPANKNTGDRYNLSLIPLKDIHLYSHYTEEAEPNGDGQSVSFLFLIAFFIVGIAWVNYINLATARSLERAREVGVRKVLGALRGELIRQFMLESLLLNLVALAIAFCLILLVNPLFGDLTGRPLTAFYSLPLSYWRIFAALFMTGVFLSGVYPALVLSRYQPVAVLKGLLRNASGGQWLRKGLIVGQFAASIVLIAATIVVYRQVHYMRSQTLGVNIGHTLVLRGAGNGISDSAYSQAYPAFREDVLKLKGVQSMTSSSGVMGKEILWSTNWRKLDEAGDRVFNLFHMGVGDDFVHSYGLRMLAGRDFSRDFNDRRSVLLNGTAVKELGYPSPEAAVGRLLRGGQGNMDSMRVVGVVADYHNEGLQKAIQPLVFFSHRNDHAWYSVKIKNDDPAAAIAAIRTVWNRYFPGDPYSYFFLDEFFDRQYAEDQRFGSVFALFAALAIAIACFGLLGLSAYNVLQRTKEIGIRKVLGASVQSLLFILSKDFLVLVVVAFLVAVPVTWLAMDSWLQGFAYRTGISWWIFGGAGLLAMGIAILTVGAQALKAAMQNPVKSLRTD